LALSPQLPHDEVLRLLEDHRLLLLERAELEGLLAELEPHFRGVRSVLNRLHRLVASTAAHADEQQSTGRSG
jgi:hypothetical protein